MRRSELAHRQGHKTTYLSEMLPSRSFHRFLLIPVIPWKWWFRVLCIQAWSYAVFGVGPRWRCILVKSVFAGALSSSLRMPLSAFSSVFAVIALLPFRLRVVLPGTLL